MHETVAEATKRKYAQYVNPGLAKLLDFAGYGVEMQAEGCDQAMSRTPSGPKC